MVIAPVRSPAPRPPRRPRPPARTGTSLKHGNADGEIFQNIRTGIRGTPMTAFAQLSSYQIWQLVSYIRSLLRPGAREEAVVGNADRGRQIFEAEDLEPVKVEEEEE